MLKCELLSFLLNTITFNQTIGIILHSKFMKDNKVQNKF
jgi:hypothetical protein